MTEVRIYFKGERVGPLFQRKMARRGRQVLLATREAAKEAAAIIEKRGKADIRRQPGNWGSRWPDGLHATVSEGGGKIKITISHDVPYFSVFQFGKRIHGNPMLWIPLDFAEDAKGVYARDYPEPLFRVDRAKPKAPLLLSVEDGQPKYFGKESVYIPKKFHVLEIARDVAKNRLPKLYRKHL